MRKKIALLLCLTLIISMICPSAQTQVNAASRAAEVINAIGIMDTDKGNTDVGTDEVTRARFAQMLVNMSTLKEDVSSESDVSLFSDVKKTHWAAGYIQTAITQGWMTGYLNGTFKPEQGITLQEAVVAIVKLLGYTSSDFNGNKVSAIMKLYKTKNLNKNISKDRTDTLTVNDCINLFYNTLNATNKTGTVYASTLGYTLDSNGNLDYLALINTGVEGPIIVNANWKNELPFQVSSAAIYKDGVKCSISDVEDYDVVYYSEYFKTVWVYDDKITGIVKAINPDYTSPTSVTIGDNDYSFADSDVTYRFTAMGDVKEGNVVTLILGKDGTIVDVLSIDEYNVAFVGVVLDVGKDFVENSDGTYTYADCVTFVTANGSEYTQVYDSSTIFLEKGDLVKVTYSSGSATVADAAIPGISLGGYSVSTDASTLGTTAFASNVKILDICGNNHINIIPERLAGVMLNSSNIYYYSLNENGQISELILADVTGDMDSYGICTGITFSGNSTLLTYKIGSKTNSVSLSSLTDFSLTTGAKGFVLTNNAIESIYDLTEISVASIGSTTLQSGNTKYPLADECSIYLLLNGEYISTTIDRISDLKKYHVKAYIDNAVLAGGRIRVIVAESIS